MTEQVNQEQEIVDDKPQYSEVELKALDMGWRPKEEFSGDEVDFIDAKEFVARKPLYDKIGQQSKQLKNTIQAVEALKEHFSKVNEAAYTRALKDLKAQRDQALVDGDADKFNKIDDEIDEARKQVESLRQEAAKPIVQEVQEVHPEFANWQSRNPWYNNTEYMRSFADKVGARLANTMTPAEVLKEVEKEVRKEFPHKFSNPNKADAPEAGASKGATRTSQGSGYQMTEVEYSIWKTLNRTDPVRFSKENYIKDLKGVK